MIRRISIVVVGRGRMGGAFVRTGREAGFEVRVYPGRARKRGRRPFARGRITWLLAVTDRAVADTCSRLVAAGWIARGDVVTHFAGMLGTDVLRAARDAGAHVAAVHPLVAVADRHRPPSLRDGAATFEGDAGALRTWRSLSRSMGLRLAPATQIDRALYHAGAALIATGGVALAQGAALAWARALVPSSERAARIFAASLLRSVAHNIASVGIDRALASPLLRGETATVQRHLRALEAAPAARNLYIAALTMVLDTFERTASLDSALIRAARAVIRESSFAPSSQRKRRTRSAR